MPRPRLLLLVALSAALVSHLFAQDAQTIRWTFDGPKAALTNLTPAWQSDLGESATTGRGVYRIRRALDTSPNAFFQLPAEFSGKPLWLLVRVAEWSLNGKTNEVVRLGFSSNDAERPSVVAQLKFERADASLLVSAESFPNTLDGSSLAAKPAGKAIAGGKLAVLLHLDPTTQTYRASMKPVGAKAWQLLGEGKIAKSRAAGFLRLGVSGPFDTTKSEKFDIEEIVVSTSDLTSQ